VEIVACGADDLSERATAATPPLIADRRRDLRERAGSLTRRTRRIAPAKADRCGIAPQVAWLTG
jgi:hypothetical protein